MYLFLSAPSGAVTPPLNGVWTNMDNSKHLLRKTFVLTPPTVSDLEGVVFKYVLASDGTLQFTAILPDTTQHQMTFRRYTERDAVAVTATEVRSWAMPTSRDDQLKLMAGTWMSSGVKYVDTIQDRFVITKNISTPQSANYITIEWNNNIITARGDDGHNTKFTYEGSSMVVALSNGSTLLLVKV